MAFAFNTVRHLVAASVVAALAPALAPTFAHATDVTTYHDDNLRTGWDQTETALTPATVAAPGFGLLQQITLDEQADAQPLFIASQRIAGGIHDVVYAATENNTIYAIDAASGAILRSRNFGTPVPIASLPGGCSNNSSHVGITSTPVIDAAHATLYFITYTMENSAPVYRLHAISPKTLAELMPSVVVKATAKLNNANTYTFNPASSRQRAALLLTSGTIYAGFASFCDVNASTTRGWVLGWNATTLAPLPANDLIDRASQQSNTYYLTSVWMSGYGIASDDQGSLFFVTGNSGGTNYRRTTNLAESVVRLSSDLTTVQSFFTPSNHVDMDQGDQDLGAGGVLLLPDQAGPTPHLAVTAGKGNPLYLLNRDKLGGLGAQPPAVQTYQNNGCWCGQSYFTGADGIGRVVTSTGHYVVVWKLQSQPTPALITESNGPQLAAGQDPGFFTTISSNGTTPNTAVIWALPHPDDNDPLHTVLLTAFDPANGARQIFSAAAGTWPHGNSNANIVPTVANGHVFVASYNQLSIFGISPPAQHVAFTAAPPPASAPYLGAKHQLFGTVIAVADNTLTVRTRTGARVTVDLAKARLTSDVTEMEIGHAALVRGDYDHAGHMIARYVMHAKDAPQLWDADR